jgi:2,3-dihydroxyphenylpropionate 1,2-dioxygenase
MTLALMCASHSPLMNDGEASDATRQKVGRAFGELARFAETFDPDFVIQFAPDHFNGLFYDLMPAFCVGVAAESIGDWGTAAGILNVPEETAHALTVQLLNNDIDVAVSDKMQVAHGFVQIWENTVASALRFPVVPVFINCAAPPLPGFRRARLLGEAAGRFALASGKKVLFAASGGLSHDPLTPQMANAPADLRARLIANRDQSAQERESREQRVLSAGRRAAAGDADILPVSEAWDHAFLQQFRDAPMAEFDNVKMPDLVQVAGRGGPEVLCWVAAMAAVSVAGPVRTDLHIYEAVQGWIAGMAMVTGRTD